VTVAPAASGAPNVPGLAGADRREPSGPGRYQQHRNVRKRMPKL